MGEIDIFVDGSLYSADVIARAAHRLTATSAVELSAAEGGFLLRVVPQSVVVDPAAIRSIFMTDLLDERLRERVAEQTRSLHEALVEAALRETRKPGA